MTRKRESPPLSPSAARNSAAVEQSKTDGNFPPLQLFQARLSRQAYIIRQLREGPLCAKSGRFVAPCWRALPIDEANCIGVTFVIERPTISQQRQSKPKWAVRNRG